jgi:RNA polymerase sigma-70 factor (ECF subfamily)
VDGSASDASLLAAVGERDLDAMRALYDRHAGWLSVRLGRRCADRDVVADALQDTFVAVWQRPKGFRGDGDVAAWLWGMARPSPAPAAEEQVLLSVEYGDAGQALAQLSPEMRVVIQAVVLDGLTTREAARLLRVPESTVKTRLSRAKVRLRAALVEGQP